MRRLQKRTATKSPRRLQYTVRDIPPHVDRALRRKALAEHKSLNEVLRNALIREVEEEGLSPRRHHDLDDLAGTWVEDPEFDAALAAQDQIDEALWR